jgi:hypothetical protein
MDALRILQAGSINLAPLEANIHIQLRALSSTYPDTNWHLWKFGHPPRYYWNNVENQRIFLDWFENEFHIKNWPDWYNVPTALLVSNGASGT